MDVGRGQGPSPVHDDPRTVEISAAMGKKEVHGRCRGKAEPVRPSGRNSPENRPRTMSENLALNDLSIGHGTGVENDHAAGGTPPASARHHPAQSTLAVAATRISDGEDGFGSRHRRSVADRGSPTRWTNSRCAEMARSRPVDGRLVPRGTPSRIIWKTSLLS